MKINSNVNSEVYGENSSLGIPLDHHRNRIPVLKDDEIDKYSYEFSLKYLPQGAEMPIDLSVFIANILSYRDYINNAFPIIKVTLILAGREMSIIKDSYGTGRVILNVDRYKILSNSSNESETDGTFQFVNNYINHESFKILDLNEEQVSDMPDSESSNSEPYIKCTLTLYAIKHLNLTKKLNDRIYINTNVRDVIAAILSKNQGIPVLMYPPHNETIYEDIVVPPVSARNAIEYIHDNYGVYKNGILVWYDFDAIYVMDKEIGIDKTTESREFKWKTVKVEVMSSRLAEPMDTHGYFEKDGESVHRVRTSLATSFQELNIAEKELFGDTIIMKGYSHDEKGTSFSVKNGDVMEDYLPKAKYHWYSGSSMFINSEFEKDLKRSSKIIVQKFSNIPLNLMTPDRYYNFTFSEDSRRERYEGDYKIFTMEIIFSKKGSASAQFIPQITCTFSKM